MNKHHQVLSRLGFIAVLVAPALLLSCQASVAQVPGSSEAPGIRVNTTEVGLGPLKEWLGLYGDVEASATVPALPDTTGRIVEVLVAPGSTVSKDQVIAWIDPSRPGMDFSLSPVKAPIPGTVVDVPVRTGAMASPQTTLALISRTSELRIITQVPEVYVLGMSLGNRAEIRTDALPGQVIPARVSRVSPVINPSSRTAEVHLTIEGGSSRLIPGMFVDVRILLRDLSDAVILDQEGLVYRGDRNYAFVVRDGVAESRELTLGIREGTMVQVLEGLDPGELVVTNGKTLLNDGAPLRLDRAQ